MGRILICGHKSFVAKGLDSKLEAFGSDYDCFSRGAEQRIGRIVTGDIMNMISNKYLSDYDVVVNFIVLKDSSIEDNLRYIASLVQFCKMRKVKKILHFSSISVYPPECNEISEDSTISEFHSSMSGYAATKIAVDNFLLNISDPILDIKFVRPGYVYANDIAIAKSGLVKKIFGINILLSDSKATLPIVRRSKLHDALISLINSDTEQKVFLFLESTLKTTKLNFVRDQWNVLLFKLPKRLVLLFARFLFFFKIINYFTHVKIVNLFKVIVYKNEFTQNVLNVNFGRTKHCVIGAGAYGSYICNALSRQYPHDDIYLFDVGDMYIKDEKSIGFLSRIKSSYSGLQKGRFFGFGGATTKWGGQLFLFGDNDFLNPSNFLKDIIELNKKWNNVVFEKFNLRSHNEDQKLVDNLFVKTGIWLSYFRRNLFRYFSVCKIKRLKIYSNSRVVKFNMSNDQIDSIEAINHEGGGTKMKFDYYFLTAGAFESTRILLNSNLISSEVVNFSDHVSQKVFKIKSGTLIGNVDLAFTIDRASLVTKRYVGEIDGVSFFCHPIYNSEFPFFQNFKKLLFGKKISFDLFLNIIKDIPSCISFAWSIIVRKKMYVYKNEYYLQIDIENFHDFGQVRLIENLDKWGQKGVEVDFITNSKTEDIFKIAKSKIKNVLDENNVSYEIVSEKTTTEKYEDTYHPYGLYSNFSSIETFFGKYKNLLVANTGILPRAGGINSTCAVFPVIEEYINNYISN